MSEITKNDLIIKQRCESMILYGHGVVKLFPKSEKHVLGAEIRKSMWLILRLIVICNRRYHKKTTLQDLSAELDMLRSQVRLSFEMRYIDIKKYEHWSKLNDEIGRLVGGWIKSFKEKDKNRDTR